MTAARHTGLPPCVLLTTDAVGGVWTYSLTLAEGFAETGIACTLAVLGPPPSPAQSEAVRGIQGVSVVKTDLPLDWMALDPATIRHGVEVLGNLARQVGAATAHLHAPVLAAFDWPVPVVAAAHSCVGTWWEAMESSPPPASFDWQMQLMRQGLLQADAVIAPSRSFAAALARVYGATGLQTIHNGAPPREASQPSAARHRLVLTAGRLWDRAKNVAVLDEAAAWVTIEAAGDADGPDGSQFRPRNIHLLGRLAPGELQGLLARAALFAAPSRYEPFGLTVLEAAQAGTPLVLADNDTFRELWDGAARFVPASDDRAWADALLHLLDAPEEREALGAAAWERARRYTSSRMVEATVALHVRAYAARAQAA